MVLPNNNITNMQL